MEKLIVELQSIRKDKKVAIENQKYENAALLRDSEKNVYNKIFKFLNKEYDYKLKDIDIDILIVNYLNDKYNENFTTNDLYNNLISIIRNIKIKKLGI